MTDFNFSFNIERLDGQWKIYQTYIMVTDNNMEFDNIRMAAANNSKSPTKKHVAACLNFLHMEYWQNGSCW